MSTLPRPIRMGFEAAPGLRALPEPRPIVAVAASARRGGRTNERSGAGEGDEDQVARGTVTPMRVSRVTSFASPSSFLPPVLAGLIGRTR